MAIWLIMMVVFKSLMAVLATGKINSYSCSSLLEDESDEGVSTVQWL
jgi:hypothetical protein